MAANQAPQETSSKNYKCSHDVFLIGSDDSGNIFTDHLYTALVQAGFRAFRGHETVPNKSADELKKTIQDSRMSVVVFSKCYAYSTWCLDQLVMILEEKRRSGGHAVLPVFYDLDPSDVRKQKGVVAAAMETHKRRFSSEGDQSCDKEGEEVMVKRWKAALGEAADLGGMVLQNLSDGHEAKFIQKTLRVIANTLRRTGLSVPYRLIGMDKRAHHINCWVQDGSADVGVLVICGMGGIGKSTIAKFVYNHNFSSFHSSSFLANIREASNHPNGLVALQQQLLYDILKGKKENISCVDEGIIRIREALSWKRILLVLDDVDCPDQLDAVFGMRSWLYPGSKIIVTTRQKNLFKPHEPHLVYNVETLDENESIELLSWHSFGEDHPPEPYGECSRRIASHCGGLPLALKVLGSSLAGKGLDFWESMLKKLKDIPNSQIIEKLKIGYESLEDDHDQNLFLHVACFFVGREKRFTVTVLDSCEFYTIVGIENLIDRNLLTVNPQNNTLEMHQLIQNMGREVVRQESPFDPGKRSRLWRSIDSFRILIQRTGSVRVRGLKLDMDEKNEWGRRVYGANYWNNKPELGRFFKETVVNLYCPDKDLDELDYFRVDGFAEMQNLELLQLSSVSVCGSYEKFPKNLRWLSWHNFELETLPGEMNLGGVAVIDLSHSKLKQVWKGTKFLRFLKILNLSHSKELIATPNFTGLPNLEQLILNHCSKLAAIHDSIGKLEMLLLLDLQNCARLRRLPDTVSALKSLETLDVAGCSSLNALPVGLKAIESLRVLRADGISMDKVAEPWSTNIIMWSWLWKAKKCPRMYLGSLPRSLVTLSLFNCSLSDAAFPREFGNLSSLENLNLGKNMISVLPEGIRRLSRLRLLEVEFCRRLTSLVALPNIEVLRTSYCKFLRDITFQEESYKGCRMERGSSHDQLKDESGEVRLVENDDTEVFYGRSLSHRSSENVVVKMSCICRF